MHHAYNMALNVSIFYEDKTNALNDFPQVSLYKCKPLAALALCDVIWFSFLNQNKPLKDPQIVIPLLLIAYFILVLPCWYPNIFTQTKKTFLGYFQFILKSRNSSNAVNYLLVSQNSVRCWLCSSCALPNFVLIMGYTCTL